jgi:hypothetical protein
MNIHSSLPCTQAEETHTYVLGMSALGNSLILKNRRFQVHVKHLKESGCFHERTICGSLAGSLRKISHIFWEPWLHTKPSSFLFLENQWVSGYIPVLAGYWLFLVNQTGRAFFKKPFVKPGGHGYWKFLKQPIPSGHGHWRFFFFFSQGLA